MSDFEGGGSPKCKIGKSPKQVWPMWGCMPQWKRFDDTLKAQSQSGEESNRCNQCKYIHIKTQVFRTHFEMQSSESKVFIKPWKWRQTVKICIQDYKIFTNTIIHNHNDTHNLVKLLFTQ